MTLHFPDGRAIHDLNTFSISAPWVLSDGLEAALRRVCVSVANACSEIAQRVGMFEAVAVESVRVCEAIDEKALAG
jgi:hypothetical protein